MQARKQSPVWPYLGILTCLFVLSITAPRAWNNRAPVAVDPLAAPPRVQPPQPPVAVIDSLPHEPLDAAEMLTRAIDLESYEPLANRGWESGGTTLIVPVELPPAVPDLPSLPAEPQWGDDVLSTAPQLTPPVAEVANLPREPLVHEMRPPQPNPVAQALEVIPPEDAQIAAVEEETTLWPMPRVLLQQLEQLSLVEPNAGWIAAASQAIQEYCRADEQCRPSQEIFAQLREFVDRYPNPSHEYRSVETQHRRTHRALVRWLEISQAAGPLDEMLAKGISTAAPERMLAAIADVEMLTRKGTTGKEWRSYLLLPELQKLSSSTSSTADADRRAIARRVLDRLTISRLNEAQRKFVAAPQIGELQRELRVWAAEPVGSQKLIADIERYEHSALPADARVVASDLRGLGWIDAAAAEEISRHLDTHYRNANLRMAVHGKLLNRMIPQPQAVESPVRDSIMNVPTVGRSTTFTKLFVRLVPDDRRIRIGLEANGLVASDTVSTKGPATLFNEGQSTFLVRKLLVLGPRGLSVWPAIAEAENNMNYLVSMETDFDGVPLVGNFVRGIARSQYENTRQEARLEVEQKVATKAREQLDAEIRPYLVNLVEAVQKRQMATINRLGMELTPVDLSTTEDRAVARLRLGGSQQLGGHTPRPQAPSDSLFSLQLHQSALNNVLEQLDLAGRTFTLPELFEWIAMKLDRPGIAKQEELPDDVRLTFATQDPVRVRCEQGRVELCMSFVELVHGKSRWKNFTVRTNYVPQADGLAPRFVREDLISLEGKSVNGKAVPLLRIIFTKVLSRNREPVLLDESITADPRLADLQISQFLIDDGWIALTYSPQRFPVNTARRK